jgi:hypothetical protein
VTREEQPQTGNGLLNPIFILCKVWGTHLSACPEWWSHASNILASKQAETRDKSCKASAAHGGDRALTDEDRIVMFSGELNGHCLRKWLRTQEDSKVYLSLCEIRKGSQKPSYL